MLIMKYTGGFFCLLSLFLTACCLYPTLAICRCPPGHMISVNGTKKSCLYTLCAMRPCHRGTCVAQSPSKFTCHCPEGYRGHRCETTLAIYREDVGLSFSSLFAICICFMALLGKSCKSVRLYYCRVSTATLPILTISNLETIMMLNIMFKARSRWMQPW